MVPSDLANRKLQGGFSFPVKVMGTDNMAKVLGVNIPLFLWNTVLFSMHFTVT